MISGISLRMLSIPGSARRPPECLTKATRLKSTNLFIETGRLVACAVSLAYRVNTRLKANTQQGELHKSASYHNRDCLFLFFFRIGVGRPRPAKQNPNGVPEI